MGSASTGPADFGVSPSRGFLPAVDPLDHLPSAFDGWERIGQSLPKYLMSDRFRTIVDGLEGFPLDCLGSDAQWERAMTLLSYLGHAYVWSGEKPAERLPANLAVPWHAVARRLGRPPVLSYASYCLHNWHRLEPERGMELGNIALIQSFLGGEDEEWFVLIHVEIEARAAPAMAELGALQNALGAKDEAAVTACLGVLAGALEGVNATMLRMVERCDPYIYFHRVRPYIHGWRNHPDLPQGVVYAGVADFEERPQTFRGETGAQSAIVPCLDAVLGVEHAPDELRSYLSEMRAYMPGEHRAFLEHLERGPNVFDFAAGAGGKLKSAYNACIGELDAFRSKHLEYAARYIFHQAQSDSKNPHDVGTGGTPFMPYLKKHRDETRHRVLG